MSLESLCRSPLQFLSVQGRIGGEDRAEIDPLEQRALLKRLAVCPLLRVLLQAQSNQLPKILVHALFQGHIFFRNLSKDLHVIGPFEGIASEMEFVSDDPERPNVALLAVLQSQSLGGEVVGRADQRFPGGVSPLRDASLGYFGLLLRSEHPLACPGSPEIDDPYPEVLPEDDVFGLYEGILTFRSR